jgi:hypothetical protein
MCRVTAGDPKRRWCQEHSNRFFFFTEEESARLVFHDKPDVVFGKANHTHNQCARWFLFFTKTFTTSPYQKQHFFNFTHTDLSAAGPPAELKHITQRRKRKQP